VCKLTLLAAVLDTLAACTPLERRVATTTVCTPHTYPVVVETGCSSLTHTLYIRILVLDTQLQRRESVHTHARLLVALTSCTLAGGGPVPIDVRLGVQCRLIPSIIICGSVDVGAALCSKHIASSLP
jgi:hypothetical protein